MRKVPLRSSFALDYSPLRFLDAAGACLLPSVSPVYREVRKTIKYKNPFHRMYYSVIYEVQNY